MESKEDCKNCGFSLSASFAFCPNCGQETKDRSQSIGEFFNHFLRDYFTFDSKIFKSVSPLLFRPGFLTKEYFIGHRVRYIPPLRLYIFISILFFLLLNLFSGTSNEVLLTEDQDWNQLFETYLPKLFFALLPLFALILLPLYLRSKASFIKHFVFSLHFHSFLFLAGSAYLLLSEIFDQLNLLWVNSILAAGFALLYLLYLFLALKRVYNQGKGKTFLKLVLLVALYGGVLFSSILVVYLLLLKQG